MRAYPWSLALRRDICAWRSAERPHRQLLRRVRLERVIGAARNIFIANFFDLSILRFFLPGCTRSVGIYVPDAAPNVLIAKFFEVSV